MSAPEVRARAALDYAIAASQRTSIPLHEVVSSLERLTHMIDLQARWDARDKAERALIEQWRERADETAASADDDEVAEAVYYHRRACADELERAIGGGR